MVQFNNDTPWIILKQEELEQTLSRVVREELDNFKNHQPTIVDSEQELLTRKESARLLKVSLTTLHRMINEHTITPIFIGKAVRFRKCDILKLS